MLTLLPMILPGCGLNPCRPPNCEGQAGACARAISDGGCDLVGALCLSGNRLSCDSIAVPNYQLVLDAGSCPMPLPQHDRCK